VIGYRKVTGSCYPILAISYQLSAHSLRLTAHDWFSSLAGKLISSRVWGDWVISIWDFEFGIYFGFGSIWIWDLTG